MNMQNCLWDAKSISNNIRNLRLRLPKLPLSEREPLLVCKIAPNVFWTDSTKLPIPSKTILRETSLANSSCSKATATAPQRVCNLVMKLANKERD